MALETFATLDAEDEVATGTVLEIVYLDQPSMSLHVFGMVASDIVQVEASNIDDADPEEAGEWEQVGSDITADGIYSVQLSARYYRANVTDVSGGGTITARFCGFDTN